MIIDYHTWTIISIHIQQLGQYWWTQCDPGEQKSKSPSSLVARSPARPPIKRAAAAGPSSWPPDRPGRGCTTCPTRPPGTGIFVGGMESGFSGKKSAKFWSLVVSCGFHDFCDSWKDRADFLAFLRWGWNSRATTNCPGCAAAAFCKIRSIHLAKYLGTRHGHHAMHNGSC